MMIISVFNRMIILLVQALGKLKSMLPACLRKKNSGKKKKYRDYFFGGGSRLSSLVFEPRIFPMCA